jgi:hypothetical protein
MAPAPELQDLIREVERDAPDGDPLTRLRTAAGIAAAVTEAADAALGYFVDQARRAGHSWAEIGEALGVSKQAAQQRQVRLTGGLSAVSFERFTPRARRVVAMSETTARDLGHAYVGTEHLLLAQFVEPGAIGAVVLTEAGLTQDGVREAVLALVGKGDATPEGDLPLTPRATEALAASLAVALELGHNYIGTEHLVLGLARTDAVASKVLRDAGLDEATLRPKVVEKLSGFVAKRAATAKKSAPKKKAARKRG